MSRSVRELFPRYDPDGLVDLIVPCPFWAMSDFFDLPRRRNRDVTLPTVPASRLMGHGEPILSTYLNVFCRVCLPTFLSARDVECNVVTVQLLSSRSAFSWVTASI
jgi:hypothetical protein